MNFFLKYSIAIFSLLITDVGAEMGVMRPFKTPKVYGVTTPVGLEILNKSKNSIWVMVRNGSDVLKKLDTHFIEIEGEKKEGKAQASQFAIDTKKPTSIAVWLKFPKTRSDKTFGYIKLFDTKNYIEEPYHFYKIKKGKTIFVTWDKENYLRPQTGPMKGRLEKTKSNLSFYDRAGNYSNVSDLDIEQKLDFLS